MTDTALPTIAGIDPRTGRALEPVARENTSADVDRVVQAAQDACGPLAALGRLGRATLLTTLAEALESRRADIVAAADVETALGVPRLESELTRTVFQLRFFADVLREGGYVEATIDHAASDTPTGPRPDLRRMLVPIGPVAVFAASNFPLAFSVAGGDTASALAAGNPVIVKVHDSHPRTAALVGGVLRSALAQAGAPQSTLDLVYGLNAGRALVAHPTVKAVSFTGSVGAARALMKVIGQREEPIPFYGELSSVNPFIVTEQAAAERAEEIGAGLVASVTGSSGQMCTKPGLVFVPRGVSGDTLVAAAAAALTGSSVVPLLNEQIKSSYENETGRLREQSGVDVVACGRRPDGTGFQAAPLLVSADVSDLPEDALAEHFGPMSVIVRYRTDDEIREVLRRVPPSLTGTVHSGADEDPSAWADTLAQSAGRLVFDGYPTGVAVTWSQHHGGPWPSTSALHTSVGATAIRRFVRPLTWQNAPTSALPDELRDGPVDLPRRVDGRLELATPSV